jgi:DNA-binding Lrp family transcriptional regulator
VPTALVFINTELGAESEVLKDVLGVKAVQEAYLTYGVYDIIAKIKADTMSELREAVTVQLRRIPKVLSTLTTVIVEQ